MKVRILLVCTLLLLAATPSFAAPQCEGCDYWSGECYWSPYSGERCTYTETGCDTYPGYCIGHSQQSTVAAEWKVVSIEIDRPTLDSKTVTSPAMVAEVQTAQPAAQK
ncbi:MAG TPA: hypothetical protein VF608_06470 [Thermoanaerobaculia bacterium]